MAAGYSSATGRLRAGLQHIGWLAASRDEFWRALVLVLEDIYRLAGPQLTIAAPQNDAAAVIYRHVDETSNQNNCTLGDHLSPSPIDLGTKKIKKNKGVRFYVSRGRGG